MIDVGGTQVWCCDECPIIEDIDWRLKWAKTPEDIQFDHCGCVKTGCEFFIGDYCEDAWSERMREQRSGRRRTGRAYRRYMRVHKFERKKELAKHCYGFWCESDSYIKRPKNSNLKNFLKRYANGKVRNTKDIGRGKRAYRRIYDVMWELW